MSQADRTTTGLDALFHPVSHYDCPEDILRDRALSATEKRMILSSWASDIYAVESEPTLREIPGITRKMRLADILAALRQLDEGDDPPPPGGATMRLSPYTRLDVHDVNLQALSGKQAASTKRPPSIALNRSRWSRDANVRRYRKLLRTRLTDRERRYVEQRLAEELGS
jgi:hypothetical protein